MAASVITEGKQILTTTRRDTFTMTHNWLIWVERVVSNMWQFGIDSWINRNEAIYGQTESDQLAKQTKEVGTQIIRQYAQDQLHVSDQDCSLFALHSRYAYADTHYTRNSCG